LSGGDNQGTGTSQRHRRNHFPNMSLQILIRKWPENCLKTILLKLCSKL
jgi:hypothetical protein